MPKEFLVSTFKLPPLINLHFPSLVERFEFVNLKYHSVNFVQVVKENQVLHKGSRIIDVESACLADLEIFPGDVLWVTDSEIHENRDIAGRKLKGLNDLLNIF